MQRGFNGLGQITSEAQGHTSAGAGSAPTVTYAYTEMSGGANHSRLTSIVYPTDLSPDSTLTFNYSGGDDTISRLTSISNDTVTLESYSYLGLGTVVKRVHPQPDLELTYIGTPADAGDQYAGLDRFGRVVDQLWNDGNTITFDRFQYTYDEDGNRITRDIVMGGSGSSDNYDEKYTYDGLNQLTQFDRGVLSGGSIASVLRKQVWDPDAVGNFSSMTTTVTGSSTVTENRDHNRQNQLTTQTIPGTSTTTLTYDNAGSTTDDGPNTLGYDAWNRLVTVNSASRYAYDALGRRVKEDTRSMFYSKEWQVLEERNSGALLYRYAWSPVYVDAMISRDKYVTGSFDSRVYVLTDANFNVTAIVSTGGTVLERFVYDPYGAFTVVNSSWGSPSGSSGYGWVYLHQGGRWDAGAGKYHFRRRDYDSALMRWTEVDPIGMNGNDQNIYRAVAGNPILNRDPDGLKIIEVDMEKEKWLDSNDLVILSCYRAKDDEGNSFPWDQWAQDRKCKIGQHFDVMAPMPNTGQSTNCAESINWVCPMIKDALKGRSTKFNRLFLVGHCGKSALPAVTFRPGGIFGIGREELNSSTLDPKLVACIQNALSGDGQLILCSCGYRYTGSTDAEKIEHAKQWDADLQSMADKLNRTVCACPLGSAQDGLTGCHCVGGKRVCATPKR